MKRVYTAVLVVLALLLVFNPINSLLAILIHKQLPHSIYLMVVGMVAAVWYRWQKDGLVAFRKAPAAIILAVALLVWCAVSSLLGYGGIGEAIRGLNVDFGGIFSFLMIWLIDPSALASKRLMQLMLIVFGVFIAFAIPDAISAQTFEGWAGYLPLHAIENIVPQIRSITNGPNPLGSLLTMAAFVVVLLYSSGWIVNVSVAVIGAFLGLTYARSAWIGTAVAAGGYFVYALVRRHKLVWWPIILGCMIFVAAAFGAIRFHEGVSGILIHGKSTVEHQQAAATAARDTRAEPVRDKLLGFGLGMAGPVVLHNQAALKRIHALRYDNPISESWYIQVSQEIGFIGLILYLAWYIETTRQLFRRNVLVGFLAVGLAVNALTLEIWAADANLNVMFWTLAGLTLYTRESRKT